MNKPEGDTKLKTPEAADYVGCSPRTLEKFRQVGAGPVFLKIGRSVVYRQSDLDSWLESRLRISTSDHGARAATSW